MALFITYSKNEYESILKQLHDVQINLDGEINEFSECVKYTSDCFVIKTFGPCQIYSKQIGPNNGLFFNNK